MRYTVPMDEGTFGEEQVKLAVETSPRLGDSCRVTEHTNSSLYCSQVAVRYHCWRLVVDAHLYCTCRICCRNYYKAYTRMGVGGEK